jgi:hypothetical protein
MTTRRRRNNDDDDDDDDSGRGRRRRYRHSNEDDVSVGGILLIIVISVICCAIVLAVGNFYRVGRERASQIEEGTAAGQTEPIYDSVPPMDNEESLSRMQARSRVNIFKTMQSAHHHHKLQ